MYITADDIEKELSFYYPIDNRSGNKTSMPNSRLLRLQFL